MRIVVITNDALQQELLTQGLMDGADITWCSAPADAPAADICLDLLFDYSESRIQQLNAMTTGLFLLHDVLLNEMPLSAPYVSVNAWPGFLKGEYMEMSTPEPSLKESAEQLLALFHKKAAWIAPTPGFIAPRVVSMIINEAYLALEEGVSTKSEIDTAMQLGTGYPYGPFDWANRIGLASVLDLLDRLSGLQHSFQPSRLLRQEAALV